MLTAIKKEGCYQCCGAKTFCFHSGSGSDFQKVSALAPAPAPAPAPTLAMYLSFITDFILKSLFFMFFMKEYQPNLHAGFYAIWILIFIYYSSWPGAGAETSTLRLPLRLQPKVPASCGSGSTTLDIISAAISRRDSNSSSYQKRVRYLLAAIKREQFLLTATVSRNEVFRLAATIREGFMLPPGEADVYASSY